MELGSTLHTNGFWKGQLDILWHIKVFNYYAPLNQHIHPSSSYHAHENAKKRMYKQHICEIEHSLFSSLVMSLTGGLGREAQAAYKCVTTLLTSKWAKPYSNKMGWLRCTLSFCPPILLYTLHDRHTFHQRPHHPQASSCGPGLL